MAKQAPAPALTSDAVVIAQPSKWLYPALTLALAAFYYFYSTRSDGFYQQDEAGHFLSMLGFWADPSSILGNWAKWGYKLIYVVPARVGGLPAVIALNCLFAASSCWLVADALRRQGNGLALGGFFLLGCMPLWVSLAFRNYSEIPTAFLLALAYWLHGRGRTLLAMLAVSYICTIRQEFIPIAGLYALALLWRREWVAAFALGIFPLLQNIYGYAYTGDPLYLLHQVTGQSGALADLYARQGFFHYFLTSMVIFGPIAVAFFVHATAWSALNKQRLDWYAWVPAVAFFLLNCAFNAQDFKFGPSTGGNLRYLLVVAPLVAVVGMQGIWAFAGQPKPIRALYYLVPLLIVTAGYMAYKSDLLKLLDGSDNQPAQRDNGPIVGVLMAGALLFAGSLQANARNYILAGCTALVALLIVRPIKRSEEDKACASLSKWYSREATLHGKPMLVNHAMFFYFSGKGRESFAPTPGYIKDSTAAAAKPGTIVLWDSHFSYRPQRSKTDVNYEYFTNKPDTWRMVYQDVTPSQTFAVFGFEKVR